jgi:hypothetical protein
MAQEAAEAFRVRPSLLFAGAPARAGAAKKKSVQEPAEAPSEEGPWFQNELVILSFAMASRAARHRLFESLAAEDFRSDSLREIFNALHEVDGELEERCDIRILERVSEENQSLLTRILVDMPQEGLDSLAELNAALRQRSELDSREQSLARREQLKRKYLAGEEWRGDLPKAEETDIAEGDGV